MFTHIVLWKLKAEAGGKSRADNARLIKERFEELANMLDGLQRLEVGIDVVHERESADLSLYAQFDSREAYEAYGAHPAHKAIADFIRDVCEDRRAIDYDA